MSTTEALIAQLTAEANATGAAIGKITRGLESLFVATASAIESGDADLQAKIDMVQSQVESLTAGLNANTLADLQKIAEIMATDEGLQSSIDVLQGLIVQNQQAIADAQAIESRLNTALVKAGADIDSLNALTASIQEAAGVLADRVTAVETRMSAVEGRVNAVEQDVAGIKSDLAAVAVNSPAAIAVGFKGVVGTAPVVTIGGVSVALDVE